MARPAALSPLDHHNPQGLHGLQGRIPPIGSPSRRRKQRGGSHQAQTQETRAEGKQKAP